MIQAHRSYIAHNSLDGCRIYFLKTPQLSKETFELVKQKFLRES